MYDAVSTLLDEDHLLKKLFFSLGRLQDEENVERYLDFIKVYKAKGKY